MIETTVLQRRELTSEHFLMGEDRHAETGVRYHGLLANPIAYHVKG